MIYRKQELNRNELTIRTTKKKMGDENAKSSVTHMQSALMIVTNVGFNKCI